MDAVTYPDESVVRVIEDAFVPYRLNFMKRHPDFKAASAGSRVMWGPTLIVADHRGSELRRWVGWLPPESFVAELEFCRALALHHRGKFADARSGFDALVAGAKGTAIHPEALYWQGIAGFMAGSQDWNALGESWRQLAADYPDNRFGTHASVIEDAPGGND